MALRPGRIYRDVPGQPYTRMSQKKDKDNYITGAPAPKISIFDMGAKEKEFEEKIVLKVDKECCIRSNALESARIAANSHLRKKVGRENYHMRIKPYPHHVLRHHPLAGIAQADRYYEGMRKPFGRSIGRAAIVNKNQEILEIRTNTKNIQAAKKAANRAGMKIPVSFRVHVK